MLQHLSISIPNQSNGNDYQSFYSKRLSHQLQHMTIKYINNKYTGIANNNLATSPS